MSTYFITKTDLQNIVGFSKHAPDSDILHIILNTQNLVLLPFLREAFYTELILQVKNDTITNENELLLYGDTNGVFLGIRHWLAYQVYANYILQSKQKSTNTGMREYEDNTSQALEAKREKALIIHYEQNADYYKKQVQNFLIKNIADYPLYENDCIKKESNNFGIYISKV